MKHCFSAWLLFKRFLSAKHTEKVISAAVSGHVQPQQVPPITGYGRVQGAARDQKKVHRACCCECTVIAKTSPNECIDIFINSEIFDSWMVRGHFWRDKLKL